jgi:hypothetical protein
MRQTSLLALLLLVAVSFGVAGGCNNNNGNNNGGGVGSPGPDGFNLELAIELGELALVAYEQRIQCIKDGKGAITVPSPYKLEEVIFEPVSSFFNDTCKDDDGVIPIAFIATEGDNIYVVFRGTANISDDLSDLVALQTPYPFVLNGGNVSLGFLDVYGLDDTEPIENTILSKLDQLTMTGNYSNLFITGHSLGAALAFLAFPDLSLNVDMIDSVTMYNFAGPAVGDSQFVSTYEATESLNRVSFRIVNTNDLVPMLPPLGLDCFLFSYEHVDGEMPITFGTPLPALPDFAADDCDLLTIGAQLAAYGINNQDDILKDHSMCTYFSTLCSMGSSPGTCSQRAIGCDDGDPNP